MNIEATNIKFKVAVALSQFSVKQLCDQWEETNRLEITVELATVRGWLQDEFERRDAVKFDAWIMSEDTEEMDHPATFFLYSKTRNQPSERL